MDIRGRCAPCFNGNEPPDTSQTVADALCGQGDFDVPGNPFTDAEDPLDPEWGATGDPVIDNLNGSLRRLWELFRPFTYAIGAPEAIFAVPASESEARSAFLVAFGTAIEEEGAEGVRIDAVEAAAVLASARPSALTATKVAACIERWNRTQDYWEMGWLNWSDVPPGHTLDFVEFDKFNHYIAESIAAGDE